MAEKSVRFLTMDILGTTKELQKGCGFLLSGEREAFDQVEGPLKKAATEVEYEPCVAYVGSSVSASYAAMVLSSMGLGMEQLVAEAYQMLHEAGFTNEEMSKSLNGWNKDSLESPFLESLVHVLKKKDQDVEGCESGEGSLLDKVLDCPLPRADDASLLREGFEHRAAVGGLAAAVQEVAVGAKREERSKGRRGRAVERSGDAVERRRVRLAEAGPRAADRGPAEHLRVRAAGAGGAELRAAAQGVGGLRLGDEAGGGRARGGGRSLLPLRTAGAVGAESGCEGVG